MSIEYLGLSEINGPLIALEGVQNAFFEEMVGCGVCGRRGAPQKGEDYCVGRGQGGDPGL